MGRCGEGKGITTNTMKPLHGAGVSSTAALSRLRMGPYLSMSDAAYQIEPLLLRVREVARLLDASPTKIYGMIERRELPCVRLKGAKRDTRKAIRIPRAALTEWLKQRTAEVVRKHGSTD
jgi:excisionase family DNA binding protein